MKTEAKEKIVEQAKFYVDLTGFADDLGRIKERSRKL